jgi:GTPase SAR1 family protein
VTASYYRGVDGIFLVYDVTSLESWKRLQEQWLPEVKEKNPTAVRLVVGNKQGLFTNLKNMMSGFSMQWRH